MSLKDICNELVYKSVFQSYGLSIRNYILSKCGDKEKSEDIVQDVFLKLWDKCKDVKFATIKPFLYRMAENLLTDHYRHQNVVLVHQKRGTSSIVNNESPIYKLEEKEFKTRLDHVINSIPEKSRIVFLMSRIENLSYREIAERLDLSQKAIEKRMGIALRIMRKEIYNK